MSVAKEPEIIHDAFDDSMVGQDRTNLPPTQGILFKKAARRGFKKGHDRYCKLVNTYLVYWTNESAHDDPSKPPRGCINLKRVQSTKVMSGNMLMLCFEDSCNSKHRTFIARDNIEAQKWNKRITERIEWGKSGKSHNTTFAKASAARKLTMQSRESMSNRMSLKLTRVLGVSSAVDFNVLYKNGNKMEKVKLQFLPKTKFCDEHMAVMDGKNQMLVKHAMDDIAAIVRKTEGTEIRIEFLSPQFEARSKRQYNKVDYTFSTSAEREDFCQTVQVFSDITLHHETERKIGPYKIEYKVDYPSRRKSGTLVLNLEEGTILLRNYIPGGTDALVQVNEYVQAVSCFDEPRVLHLGSAMGLKGLRNMNEGVVVRFALASIRERCAGRLRALTNNIRKPETFKGWESITHLNLDIFCTTFNAGGKDFSHFVGKKDASQSSVANKNKILSKWIPRDKSYDIYCFALQETKKFDVWRKELQAYLTHVVKTEQDPRYVHGDAYMLLHMNSQGPLHLVLFMRPLIASRVSNVVWDNVPTGKELMGKKLNNKGGLGCGFLYNSSSRICFIGCHLNARAERVAKRAKDFDSIYSEMNLEQPTQLAHHYHHVFWLGDLNYRLDLSPTFPMNSRAEFEAVRKLVKMEDWDELIAHDQLKHQIQEEKAFWRFQEGKIAFPPTYRMVSKQKLEYGIKSETRFQAPSYTDRVLWHSIKGLEVDVKCEKYWAAHDFLGSDHRGVCAVFHLHTRLPYINVQKVTGSFGMQMPSITTCNLRFKELTVEEEKKDIPNKQPRQRKFSRARAPSVPQSEGYFAEFWHQYLPVDGQTSQLATYDIKQRDWMWAPDQLPILLPCVCESEFLSYRNLTIAIRTGRRKKLVAQTTISLREAYTNVLENKPPYKFEEIATLNGRPAGIISGEITLQDMNKVKEKSSNEIDDVQRYINRRQSMRLRMKNFPGTLESSDGSLDPSKLSTVKEEDNDSAGALKERAMSALLDKDKHRSMSTFGYAAQSIYQACHKGRASAKSTRSKSGLSESDASPPPPVWEEEEGDDSSEDPPEWRSSDEEDNDREVLPPPSLESLEPPSTPREAFATPGTPGPPPTPDEISRETLDVQQLELLPEPYSTQTSPAPSTIIPVLMYRQPVGFKLRSSMLDWTNKCNGDVRALMRDVESSKIALPKEGVYVLSNEMTETTHSTPAYYYISSGLHLNFDISTTAPIASFTRSPKVGPQRRSSRCQRRRSTYPLPPDKNRGAPEGFMPGAKVICISEMGKRKGQVGTLIRRTGYEGKWLIKWSLDGAKMEFPDSALKLYVINPDLPKSLGHQRKSSWNKPKRPAHPPPRISNKYMITNLNSHSFSDVIDAQVSDSDSYSTLASAKSFVSPPTSTNASTAHVGAFSASGLSVPSPSSRNNDSEKTTSGSSIEVRASMKDVLVATNQKLAKRQWKGFAPPVDEEHAPSSPEPDSREELPPPPVDSPSAHSVPEHSRPLYQSPPPAYKSPSADTHEDSDENVSGTYTRI